MFKLLIILSLSLIADDFGGFGHPNKGCPFNSICGKEMGLKKYQWDELLKSLPKEKSHAVKKLDNFRKKNGILVPVWTVSNPQEESDLIKWHSPCPQHQKEDNKYFQAEVFTSNFSKLDKNRFIEEEALLLKEDNSIVSYKIPNKELPLYLIGQEMIFSMTSEGTYYYLGVNPSGNLRVIDSSPMDFSVQDAECPKILINQFDQLTNGLYSGHFCKNIYNSLLKKYQTLLFGLTCV
jgi:hypothetical protein